MPVFYLKYTINESARSDCMTLFGGMTPEMDAQDMGPDIRLIGRWSTVGESAGYCICEAKNAKVLNAWLLNWSVMATIECHPVVDDNMAREIILKEKPSFIVDYSTNEAKEGESLYFIEYKFSEFNREAGYSAFSQMSEEDDAKDSGNNTCLGRWHNIGLGSGIAICSSKSEMDLYKWAYNWTNLCDCSIKPVVSDFDLRENIKSKPDFQAKYSTLMDKLRGKKYYFWR